MTVKGIDVAGYQNATYSTVGLAFVMVKATEGTGYINPKHPAQVAHARAEGQVVGHYHFQRPGSPTAQAAYFLQHAAAKAGDFLACDWEDTAVPDEDKDAWIRAVQAEQPHLRVLLYCNRDFWLNRDHTSFCGDGLWIADPSAPAGKPRVAHAWTFHQYGIRGTDVDVANFASAAALRAWANKSSTPTSPQEDDMPLTDADAKKVAQAVWDLDAIPAARPPYANADFKTNPTWQAKYAVQTGVEGTRTAVAQIAGLTAAVQTLAGKVGSGDDTAAIVAAVQKAIADAVVKVTVSSQAAPDA
jgi:GH25 family lysozyme M1 (1,4-beta-N-acetylmuramidase)